VTVADARAIRRPIHVLGFARSGTTMLARTFRAHPEISFMTEPRTVWSIGHAYRQDDELGADDASERIARRIDRRFAAMMRERGGTRFAEKTPSNCLRVPFVHAIYPDGRFVHIVRDGRDAVRSLLLAETRTPPAGRLRQRLRETPASDWPAQVPTLLRTVWRTRVLRKPASFWGPKPRGWKQWLDLPAHERAAHQWRACVEKALADGRALPAESYMEVRYEAFVADPVEWCRRIFAFVDLPFAPEVEQHVREHVRGPRTRASGEGLGAERERAIEEIMRPTLASLGYLGAG
jgi:hypothetical protein